MEEKRNIQISLEEAREWYNSGDSFKKELALKAYKKEELELSYFNILHKLPDDITRKNALKSDMYLKLINVAEYLYKKYKPTVVNHNYVYYLIVPKLPITFSAKYTNYKDFSIKVTSIKPNNVYFNSLKAAKQAIDILGDELKILFE